MLDIIKETFTKDNREGDKEFIDELVDGLSEEELKALKSVAFKLMKSQEIAKSFYRVMYRNAYKYIACRRLYKKEIESYTQRKIMGDYISEVSNRWVTIRS